MASPSKDGRLRPLRWLPLILALTVVAWALLRDRGSGELEPESPVPRPVETTAPDVPAIAPPPTDPTPVVDLEPPERESAPEPVASGSFPAYPPIDPAFLRPSPLEVVGIPLAVAFDHPLGAANGSFSYNAQSFLSSRHLGDDLNGVGGWNSDFGDPVYAMGVGEIAFAGFAGDGWGNMVVISHRVSKEDAEREGIPGGILQSVYAHLAEVKVVAGTAAYRGQQIGTVGNADGRYFAHLHFELRPLAGTDPGVGYADTPLGRLNPSRFLKRSEGDDPSFLMLAPEEVLRSPPQIRPLIELPASQPEG